MAWTNDVTVRAMAMPYHFNSVSMFKKIISDMRNEQDDEGRLTCTAPFVFGERPGDPVCTANTISAIEIYRMTGDTSFIAKNYDSLKLLLINYACSSLS
jgi:alpha-L-rhamnosidase